MGGGSLQSSEVSFWLAVAEDPVSTFESVAPDNRCFPAAPSLWIVATRNEKKIFQKKDSVHADSVKALARCGAHPQSCPLNSRMNRRFRFEGRQASQTRTLSPC